MPHETTIFEREPLYAEVWKEPVTEVAKRYGISDVALRKICVRLGVPVPPLGYWAKLAAGKKSFITRLPADHKGDTRYVRSRYIDSEAPERDARIASLLAQHPLPELPPSSLKASLDECHPIVRRTSKALGPRSRNDRGLLQSDGQEVLEVCVSQLQRDRALLILDAVLTTALAAGATLCKAAKEDGRPHLTLFGESLYVQILEPTERFERALTPKELKEQKEGRLYYIRDKYEFKGTGKLKLVVANSERYYPLATLSDGVATPLELRLEGLAATLQSKAAELRVRREMSEEEHKRWEAERARREARERIRDKELERLKKTEDWVKAWRRAEELRAFSKAIEDQAAAAADPEDISSVAEEVAWIRNAADWLDPLVEMTWPAVDARGSDADDD